MTFKFYRSIRIGWFELTISWNKSLNQFIIAIGQRNPEFDRFHIDGDPKKAKRWKPFFYYKSDKNFKK